MDINKKVTLLRDTFCEGSNLKFAKLMDASPTTVSNWCKADSLGKDVLVKILSKLPNVDANWLLMDTGEMLKVQHTNADSVSLQKEIEELKNELKELSKENYMLQGENKVLREQIGLGERKKDRSA